MGVWAPLVTMRRRCVSAPRRLKKGVRRAKKTADARPGALAHARANIGWVKARFVETPAVNLISIGVFLIKHSQAPLRKHHKRIEWQIEADTLCLQIRLSSAPTSIKGAHSFLRWESRQRNFFSGREKSPGDFIERQVITYEFHIDPNAPIKGEGEDRNILRMRKIEVK